MNSENGLPLHTAPVDHFRYGFESLETQMTQSNPVMAFEKNVCISTPTIICPESNVFVSAGAT